MRISERGFLARREGIDLAVAVNGQTLIQDYNDVQPAGYFLFDSTPFGSIEAVRREAIPSFSVVYPGGRIRTFYNVTATQNVFSEASGTLLSSTRKK